MWTVILVFSSVVYLMTTGWLITPNGKPFWWRDVGWPEAIPQLNAHKDRVANFSEHYYLGRVFAGLFVGLLIADSVGQLFKIGPFRFGPTIEILLGMAGCWAIVHFAILRKMEGSRRSAKHPQGLE